MYPLAHAWMLTRLVSNPTPAAYLGCVWPDMRFEGSLSHSQSHASGAALAAYANTVADADGAREFRTFVTGVLTHGSEPHGFDWYSDEEWGGRPLAEKGYAFQRGSVLAAAAAAACDVPSYNGAWKAHNLIEIAFERPLYTAFPELGDALEAACADSALIERIASHLAGFFGLPAAELAAPMRRFRDVVLLRPHSARAWAPVYALQTRLKHSGANPDIPALERLIERAEDLIATDSQSYLEECVDRVGTMLRSAGLAQVTEE